MNKNITSVLITLIKHKSFLSILCIVVMFFSAGTAQALLPVTGVEVSELAPFDNLMQSYMANVEVTAGVLAISKDGRVVYQRGFGYAYNGIDPLPENTPMRLASVEKPPTAAVIRHLIADGVISGTDFVFDVGQTLAPGQQALLDASTSSSTYHPYNNTYGNPTYVDAVTVNHLLGHRGGWDRKLAYDPFGRLLTIGLVTGVYPASPPTREDIVQYMMAQPMQFDPTNHVKCAKDTSDNCIVTTSPTCYCDPYSNYGYMLLSLIIEQETPWQHTSYIRQRVMTPDIWVPSTEIFLGRDFRGQQNSREPLYASTNTCVNLTDPYLLYPIFNPEVPCPYGGFLIEVKTGEGNLVGSAGALMMFMNHYRASSGIPLTGPVDSAKNGGFDGTSTRIEQRGDGFNVVVLFPHGGEHEAQVASQTYLYIDLLGGSVDWASLKEIDGFWVDFNASSSGYGGHDDPFHDMDTLLTDTTDGTKVRFKTGTSNWTGTISTKMLLNSPFGTAIIGQ